MNQRPAGEITTVMSDDNHEKIPLPDRFAGCLLGLAVGDALGAPVEGLPRGSFAPVRDMIGSPQRGLAPGEWTDDTALALALGHSLVLRQGFDPSDQMERYCRWLEEGHLRCADSRLFVGRTTHEALLRFRATGNPFCGSDSLETATNGCIMRLAPVAMFYFRDVQQAEFYAAESARTTHAFAACTDAARLLARMLVRALSGASRDTILLADAGYFHGVPGIMLLAEGAYLHKTPGEIRGSSNVVESLEAALWCFATTRSFEEAIVCAVNLGDDADTTAAVCGQIAGAYYGCQAIPSRWVSVLAKREAICQLAQELLHAALARPT
ncbi:MAG: ADP-ribosylglycohydrolase [Pirellulaceae bacterium]|nr:MAG: ADP-ribosylglycohydrolase [Pirellulaceae bacterium]